MQIIFLPTVWTIIIDSVAWGIIQPFIAWLGIQFPPQWIQPDLWLYKERGWEKGGMLYQELFKVRSWKAKLPDGGSLFRDDFNINAFTQPKRCQRCGVVYVFYVYSGEQ